VEAHSREEVFGAASRQGKISGNPLPLLDLVPSSLNMIYYIHTNEEGGYI
jgi:hypothetical protein